MAGAKRVVVSEEGFAEKKKQKSPEVVGVVHDASYQMLQTVASVAAAHTSGEFAFDGEQIHPVVSQWHDLGSGDEDDVSCQAYATAVASEQELSGCW